MMYVFVPVAYVRTGIDRRDVRTWTLSIYAVQQADKKLLVLAVIVASIPMERSRPARKHRRARVSLACGSAEIHAP